MEGDSKHPGINLEHLKTSVTLLPSCMTRKGMIL